VVYILEPGAEAPGYGFFSEININIVFWLPGAAEAEPVEAKHRALDSWPEKTSISFFGYPALRKLSLSKLSTGLWILCRKNIKNLFANQSHFLF